MNDPNARPSRIEGQIKGDGTVPLINRNGIIFSGSAQVNVRNLVAAASQAAEQIARQAQRNQPSVISVEILGYGNDRLEASGSGAPTVAAVADAQGYDAHSPLKVLGSGKPDPTQLDHLTAQEKKNLM